jgi:arabinofuranan 3-O-arabinosyltransferase
VVDPGEAGRNSRDDVRLDLVEPAWLVLGQSLGAGWRASCDGRSLGKPEVLDAFANAWRLDRGCRDLDVDFRPQRLVDAGYGAGALGCLVLLCVLLLRRPRRLPEAAPEPLPADDRPRRLPARRALVAGAAAGAVFGFVFALRAGVVVGPAVALILWRGLSARQLILAAGGLLALVVPALYLLFPAEDRGGYNSDYAADHLAAHWVAVGAVVLLVLALAWTLAGAFPRRSTRALRTRSTASAASTTSETSAAWRNRVSP